MAVILVLAFSLKGIAGFYTDYLWFRSLGRTGTWRTMLFTKVGLVLVFFVLFFAALFANLLLADRLKPEIQVAGPEHDGVQQFLTAIGHRVGLFRVGVCAVFSLFAGLTAADQWRNYLMWSNSVSFGRTDAQFQTDVGFYIFKLPFLDFLKSWAFLGLIIIVVLTAGAHYLSGGIRLQVQGDRFSPAVKAHLSVLMALVAIVKLIGYILDRYQLTVSDRGYVNGATYTDVHAKLPALTLLMFVSIFAAIFFVVNIWRRGWVLPVVSVSLWAFIALVVGTIYPAAIQRFGVQPSESKKELPYIARNISATQEALGIDGVTTAPFEYAARLTDGESKSVTSTLNNVRILDPNLVIDAYQNLQGVNTAYRFTDLDVDRYNIGGKPTQVVLAARELNSAQVPQTSWEGLHLAYTHGYGIVAAPSNQVTVDGRPEFILKDLPPKENPDIVVKQPAIYFGEKLDGYAIVNSGRTEVDYVKDDGTTQSTAYAGAGGVALDSVIKRAAYAIQFGDINPLISNYVGDSSRILYVQDVRARVAKLAPFLATDADPYPVVLDGKVLWVVDGYTTSDRYPNAQKANTSGVSSASGLTGSFNYVRNSVKAVVDAYDVSVKLYVIDKFDPIAQMWSMAFPDLFAPSEEMPAGLREHLRYPEDLFRVQTTMWGRYHLTDPKGFYEATDRWNVAQNPGTEVVAASETAGSSTSSTTGGTTSASASASDTGAKIDPYYQLMKLPGSTKDEFVLFRPFVPYSDDDARKNLTAFMVADSDPEHYGRLRIFTMPRDRSIDGPSIVSANIKSQPEISKEFTLLEGKGSKVLQGNLLLIPIDKTLLYVRPIYVRSDDKNSVPELKRVIVNYGGTSYIGNTFTEALAKAFGSTGAVTPTTPTTTIPPTTGTTTPSATPGAGDTVASLLAEADGHFQKADAALTARDLQTYQSEIEKARVAVQKAKTLSGK